jgi:YD repeat-containing protein
VLYAHDDAGQLTSQTDAMGQVTSFEYDDLGRMTEKTLPDPDGTGPQTAPVYEYTYDLAGNLIKVGSVEAF